jgi:hypothetical protein
MMYTKTLPLLLLLPLLFLCSCARADASSAQVLSALIDAEIGLPAGQIYLSSAPEDDASYLSPDLVAALYGEGELPWQLSLLEDYGLFLSTAQHPCEFAVFRTRSRSDTDEIAAMCLARLDALRIHYKDTQYASYTQNARVVVIDKYVLLLISSDTEHALRAAERVI